MKIGRDLILAGDIGGTKTNLAIYAPDSGWKNPLASTAYASAEYADLDSMLAEFLADTGLKVRRAAFGVAGPVLAGRAKITKLPWIIDSRLLRQQFGFSQVILVNDLVATAHGLAALGAADFACLNAGAIRAEAPRVIIAPGTGLGETFMLWGNGRYLPYASEGGHTPFAPADKLQDQLLAYLRPKYPVISSDLVGSGRGIPLLYNFLRKIKHADEIASVALELAKSKEQTPIIVRAALAASPSPLCAATLELFVAILAAEAANFALKIMAGGGVFLGGGMSPRILPILREKFMASFARHDVLQDLLVDMPVQVIMEPKTALLGAARLLSHM